MLILPSEIKGNIYSKLSLPLPSELKYSSKATFNEMRYLTHLKGTFFLKSLFIKSKDSTVSPSLYYYNLKSISGIIIVESIEELKLVPLLLDKLNSITIEYIGDLFKDIPDLIQSFIQQSKTSYMKIYDKAKPSNKYIIERRDGLIVASMSDLEDIQNIEDIEDIKDIDIDKYLKGVDSLLIPDIYAHVVVLINKTDIKMLHLDRSCSEYPTEILTQIDTLYITSNFNYNNVFRFNEGPPNTSITKVVFSDILVSNETNADYHGIEIYSIFSNIFPKAKIPVFKFGDGELKGDNVVEVTDNLLVTRLANHKLSSLLLSDGEPRFPNLRKIDEIIIPMEEYDQSIEMIKKAIKGTIDTLHIRIDDKRGVQADILKYITLLGKTVKSKLFVGMVMYYDGFSQFDTIFKMSILGDKILLKIGDCLRLEDELDISYLDIEKTIIDLGDYSYGFSVNIEDIFNRFNINKILVDELSIVTVIELEVDVGMTMLKRIETLYIDGEIRKTKQLENKIYPCIKEIFLLTEDSVSSFLRALFPNAEFHLPS